MTKVAKISNEFANLKIGDSGKSFNDCFKHYDSLYNGSAIVLNSEYQRIYFNRFINDYKLIFIILRNNYNINTCWVLPNYFINALINLSYPIFLDDGACDIVGISPQGLHDNYVEMNLKKTQIGASFVGAYGLK